MEWAIVCPELVGIFVPAKEGGPPLVIARPLHRLHTINELSQPLFFAENLSVGRIGLDLSSLGGNEHRKDGIVLVPSPLAALAAMS